MESPRMEQVFTQKKHIWNLCKPVAIGLFAILLVPFNIQAQDPEFSQFYAAPVHLNPAMAGTSECHRFAFAYRDQWPAIDRLFVTYYASYDNYFEDISGSIGLWYMGDHQANATYNTQTISGIYAFRASFGKVDFQIAAEGSYQHIGVKRDRLVFPDEIVDPVTGEVRQTGYDRGYLLPGTSFADFSFGVLAYSSSLYGGVAVKHITQPQMSLINGNTLGSPLPTRITAHLGTVVSLLNRFNVKHFISPEILFTQQDDFRQLNLGLYYSNEFFYAGMWLRHAFANHDAIIPYIGIYRSPFKAGYSYDLTFSSLGVNRTAGAHELSFSFNVCGKEKPKVLYCPRFF